MATLAENAAAVKAAQVAIDAAIVAKGGTTIGGLANAAAAISAIPSGEAWREWWMGEDWPNLREIVAEDEPDETGFTHKVGFLIEKFRKGDYLCFLYANMPTSGAAFRIRTDDGRWLTANANDYKVEFPDDPADFFGCHWVIVYINGSAMSSITTSMPIPCHNQSGWSSQQTTPNPVWAVAGDSFDMSWYSNWGNAINTRNGLIAVEGLRLVNNLSWSYDFIGEAGYEKITSIRNCYFKNSSNSGSKFRLCYMLAEILDSELDIGSSAGSWFQSCTSLKMVTGTVTSEHETYSLGSMFTGCFSLEQIPTIDFSRATNVSSMFDQCRSLPSVQDDMDLTAMTSDPANMFRNCYSLRNLPRNLKGPNDEFNYTISFAQSILIDPASLSVFENGVLTGGMIYNLNDVTNDGGYTRTITLPTTLREKFTDDEASTIISTANSRGWTLGNFAQ